LIFNNHGIVHQVGFLTPIEPNLVGHIILGFLDLDEHAINEPMDECMVE
jgi:hypothetical protein